MNHGCLAFVCSSMSLKTVDDISLPTYGSDNQLLHLAITKVSLNNSVLTDMEFEVDVQFFRPGREISAYASILRKRFFSWLSPFLVGFHPLLQIVL